MIVHGNDETRNRIGSPEHPGLKRGELTRDGKRLQLASKNIRGAEADEVLNRLYGAEIK